MAEYATATGLIRAPRSGGVRLLSLAFLGPICRETCPDARYRIVRTFVGSLR